MTLYRATTRLLLLVACAAQAQQAAAPDPQPVRPHSPRAESNSFNPNLVVLDPAHGGQDDGGHFADNIAEKDVTMALTTRLQALLNARGFTVVLTHAAASDDTPPDQRVELANRAHALACLIVHASAGGHGMHLFTSSLPPSAEPFTGAEPLSFTPIIPWDTAQASYLEPSGRLIGDLATAINGDQIPLMTGHVSVRPVDSLACPAVTIEIAPLGSGDSRTPVSDDTYQQRAANAVTAGLSLWRGHAMAMIAAEQADSNPKAGQTPDQSPTPAPVRKSPAKPKPKPVPPQRFPDETPLTTAPASGPPAPRSAPPTAPSPASPPRRGQR